MTEHTNLLPRDGEAFLFPDFFSDEESNSLFKALANNIAWKQEPIKIMGKEIMQPRLTAWYGDNGKSYKYSGITMHPHAWSEDLLLIKNRVENVSGYTFTNVLLNFYRDGNDSMGWHKDNEKELGINPAIGSVSFGTSRSFNFKHTQDKNLKAKILLTHGSFLLMAGSTQHFWYHSIPKAPKLTEPRINLTFRKLL